MRFLSFCEDAFLNDNAFFKS